MCDNVIALVKGRLEMGMKKYGHGIAADDDTKRYGTQSGTWLEMATEEYLDALVYLGAEMVRIEPKLMIDGDVQDNINDSILFLIEKGPFVNFSIMNSSEHAAKLFRINKLLLNTLDHVQTLQSLYSP